MKYFEFTEQEKAQRFDEIAAHFYSQNFGQMSKADIELMMFHIYINKMISSIVADDGTVDYSQCSDYRISKELGITQQRVRNLKIKNQLMYPIAYDWMKAFAKLTENARYEGKTGRVLINIPDPNLYLEIQNFIEEKGAFVEKQLNSKILQLRAEYYIDLIVSLEDEPNRQKIIKKLKKEFSAHFSEDHKFDERNIGKSLIDGAVSATTVAANISTLISPENYLGKAFVALMNSVMQ